MTEADRQRDYRLEVVVLPVRDVDRSLAFYTERCGFHLDTDYQPSEGFRLAQITPPGSACSLQTGIGLTDAEPGSSRGWVVVGNLPTTDGTAATASAGDLIVLNSYGQVAETWSGHHINGPWDLTSVSDGTRSEVFVSNVLNGTVKHSPATVDGGTVVRLDVALDRTAAPRLIGDTAIASGFAERTDPAALVVGPTGLALGRDGELCVADTVNSRIAAVPDATDRRMALADAGFTVSSGGALNGPLGMALAPNGHILTVNGGNGNVVETTPGGDQLAARQIDPAGAGGDLFGMVVADHHRGVLFVDDADNSVKLLS